MRVPHVCLVLADVGGQQSQLTEMSSRMTEFEAQVLADLSVLKHQMAALYGDGDSGRVAAIERRIAAHEQALQRAKGFGLATATVFTAAQMILEYLRFK